MAHTHDETLTATQAQLPEAVDVAQVYPDDDTQWWVEDVSHNVFAYAWWETQTELLTKPYHP
jgi:hypothetical protein